MVFMIQVIYSKINPDRVLHGIVRKSDLSAKRTDLVDPDEFLQCAAIRLDRGETFKAHQHRWNIKQSHNYIAQESWVVISGNVKVFYYDTDGTLLHEDVITPGDASFTFEGGHNYECMTDGTFVYEFKTGPYLGQEMDKIFL